MEKRAAIFCAAKELFVEKGFEGTSMDAIAAAAGVSKLTVYSHFGDKDTLFREAVRERCKEVLPETLYHATPGEDISEALLAIAMRHAVLVVSEESVGVWRLISNDCRQGRPRMGQLLWEEGPARTQSLLERFLRTKVDAGALDIPDAAVAASQFLALIKGDLQFRCWLGVDDAGDASFQDEVRANAEAAVTMFMRAYAPR